MASHLGEKLKRLRKERRWTLKEVAEKLGLKSFSTYSNWEYGRSTPDYESLKAIAKLYDVSVDELLKNQGNEMVQIMLDIQSEQKKDKENKDKEYTDLVFLDPPYLNRSKILKIPVLGMIAAGRPILAEEHIKDWMMIPNMWNLKEGDVFALEVKGDSMIGSRIYEGDKVIVKVQPDVESGEIAVVNVNGNDATLKRVKKLDGKVILFPDNPRYEPKVVQHEDARIIGKVIQVMFEPGK